LDVTGDHLVYRATSGSTGRFVPAADLQAGDRLVWRRAQDWGTGTIGPLAVADAALAGWLQTDGFVGQYDHGTNRSLTVEFLTVTEAEFEWVTHHLDVAFPHIHRHVRSIDVQDDTLVARRIRLYGEGLRN